MEELPPPPSVPGGGGGGGSGFVTVRDGFFAGGDGARLRFVGSNGYQVPELYARGDRDGAEGILSQAERQGMNAIRFFVSSEVGQVGHLWRVGAGGAVELRPDAAEALDLAVRGASARGLRPILCLENYWNVREADGVSSGADAFVEAASRRPGGPATRDRREFFSNPVARAMYKEYLRAVVPRYVEERGILGWELLNEPRCEGCPDGVLESWVGEMAREVKSLDPNHLLTVGVEGFYSEAGTPNRARAVNPGSWAGRQGQDFIKLHRSPDVDFGVVHLWSKKWGVPEAERLGFASGWVSAHAEDMSALGKPLLLEEFGLELAEPPRDLSQRDLVFSEVYAVVEEVAAGASSLQGSLFWAFYQDKDDRCGSAACDGYGVEVSDRSTLAVVSAHIAAWLRPAPPPAAAAMSLAPDPASSAGSGGGGGGAAEARRLRRRVRRRLRRLYRGAP